MEILLQYLFDIWNWLRILIVAAAALALEKTLRDGITATKAKWTDKLREKDYVTVGNYTGKVQDVSPWGLTLATAKNEAIYVPNNKIEEDVVVKHTAYDGYYNLVIDVPVLFPHNPFDVRYIIQEIAKNYDGHISSYVNSRYAYRDGMTFIVYHLHYTIDDLSETGYTRSDLCEKIYKEFRERGYIE